MRVSPLLFCLACGGAAADDAVDAGPPADDATVHPDGPPGAVDAGPRIAIPIGIENVNDSPLKAARYRTLLRFVPREDLAIDRFYFGFKLRGAACDGPGSGGYGAGDGGLLRGELVGIDASGRPGEILASETVNGCERWLEAKGEANATPVLVWVNVEATLQAGQMYGLVVGNAHADPAENFFSFNMPLADSELAGPHARNETDAAAAGAILGLDPREHVAWSEDEGASWAYGSANGPYRSFMNDDDRAHPATRMPQYGFRTGAAETVAGQPYYAYSTDCVGCTVTYVHAAPRTIARLGGFTASGDDVGTLTVKSAAGEAGCTPEKGYGFRTCTLAAPISAATYSLHASGSVEVMRMDFQQRQLFPAAGERIFQAEPGAGTS